MIKLKNILFESKITESSAYKTASRNELAMYISQLSTTIKGTKDRKMLNLLKKTKKEVEKELKSRKTNESKLNEDLGFAPDPDVGKNFSMYASPKRKGSDMKAFMRAYSSNEAKKIVEGKLAMYVKEMRQLQYKLVKDWMSAAKAGAIDFFDLIRGFNTGDVNRAHSYEIKFLHGLLTKDKISNRFRSYFKGRKGKPRKGDKWGN